MRALDRIAMPHGAIMPGLIIIRRHHDSAMASRALRRFKRFGARLRHYKAGE